MKREGRLKREVERGRGGEKGRLKRRGKGREGEGSGVILPGN